MRENELNYELSVECGRFIAGIFSQPWLLPDIEKGVKRLIEEGANPNKPYKSFIFGYVSQQPAVIEEYCRVPEILEILLKNGGDPNYRNEEGNTLAHSVVGMGHARYDSLSDADYLESLKLLKDYGADISALNKFGESILCAPIYNYRKLSDEIVSFALENGCKPMTESEKAFKEVRNKGCPIRNLRYFRHCYEPDDPLEEKAKRLQGEDEDVVERYKAALDEKKYVENLNRRKREREREREEEGKDPRIDQEELFKYQRIKKAKAAYRRKHKNNEPIQKDNGGR